MSVVLMKKTTTSKFTHWNNQLSIGQEKAQSLHSKIRYKERDGIISVVITEENKQFHSLENIN